MFRASDGKTRIDSGNTSVITAPGAGHALVLDHLKQQAFFLRLKPKAPVMPPVALPAKPGAPAQPPPPSAPTVHVQDLGKGLIEGHEVDGKRYIIQPPKRPAGPPQPPQAPALPQAPGMSAASPPKLPQQTPPPPQPPVPTVADVWTSSKLGLPMLTKVTGPFGQQTTACKSVAAQEPHPALFQIPPGYKPVMPAPPVKP